MLRARRPRASRARAAGRTAPILAALAVALVARGAPAQLPLAEAGGLPPGSPTFTTLVYPPFAHTLGIHRARPEHLKLFLGDRTRFDDPQGLAAVKLASDDDPDASSDDYQLTLFGVNSGRGEILYNSTMQTLAIYGRQGSGEGHLDSPHGIAAMPDGRVYVADTGNRRVVRLRWDPVARGLTWAGEWPAGAPFDVAGDARGQLYVSDRSTDGVLRFADSTAGAGTSLLASSPVVGARWPLPADVRAPRGLAVADSLDPWYRPRIYRLYLVDLDGGRLRACGADGAVLAETVPDSLPRPRGGAGRFDYVALDYFGNVYVSDPTANVLYKFDADLHWLTTFPGPGRAEDAFEEPRGIALWKRFGQVFVAEREGAQYFFVGTDFRPLQEPVEVRREAPGTWAFDLWLTEAAQITTAFEDAAGDTLAVAEAGVFGTGRQAISWGESAWRAAPPEGWEARAGKVTIEARPTYSSKKKFSRIRTLRVAFAP